MCKTKSGACSFSFPVSTNLKWYSLVYISRKGLQFKSKELSSGVVQGSSILQKGCLACHATGHGQYESMFIYLEIYNIIWRCACSAEGPFCIWSLVLNTPTVNSPSAHTTLTVQRSNGLPHRAIPRSSFRELAEAASECARFPLPPGPTQDGESPRVLVHTFSVYRAETMHVVSGQAVPPFPARSRSSSKLFLRRVSGLAMPRLAPPVTLSDTL